ncbi:MAG: hypothetical protein NTY06_00905 [Candidatus Gottesmanbacteria bacterium]|nr:hypothetical protein [Candidatus Gottesmanbacteria bacterium]
MDSIIPPQPPPTQPIMSTPAKPKSSLLTGFIVIILLLFLGAVGFLVYQNRQLKQQISHVQPTPTPLITPITTPDPTANWKTFTLNEIIFRYPPNWTNQEYVQTPFGAEIKSNDGTQRIVVLSGINKGHTTADLSEFINSLIANGANRLTLNGSEASESKITYQGSKISTVYVTSKDKTSQYSITLQAPEAYSDQQIDELLSKILSTFKFTN